MLAPWPIGDKPPRFMQQRHMYQVMKALREVRFNGSMVPDHIPQLAGNTGLRRAGTAYCIAYMRSPLRRANEEVD